jgi:hypothetical protein
MKNLIVTCCNKNGGIYRINPNIECCPPIEKITDMEARGIAVYKNKYVVVCGMGGEKRRGLHLFSKNWQHLADFGGNADWHGVTVHNGFVYAVDAATCRVMKFARDLNHIHEVFEFGLGVKLINDIVICGQTIIASTFNNGIICYDMTTKSKTPYFAVPYFQPHTIQKHGDRMVWCNSGLGKVMENGDTIWNFPGEYVRGYLRRHNEKTMLNETFIGLSAHRKDNPNGRAKLYINTGIYDGEIEFDSPEIYSIIEEI